MYRGEARPSSRHGRSLGATVPPVSTSEVAAQRFGSDTARVVTAFKTRNNILNTAGRIDPIVGRKTVAALDLVMLGAAPAPPAPVSEAGEADVVVKFQGAAPGTSGDLTPNGAYADMMLGAYEPVPEFGKLAVMQRRDTRRKLIRLGRLTTTIGDQSIEMFSLMYTKILQSLLLVKATPRSVAVYGSSSGGRNALDFADYLSVRGLVPKVVISMDAAFFQADTASRPEANVDNPTRVPNFKAQSQRVRSRHNFYQTKGNHAKRTLAHGVLFASKMQGEEIHGTVDGFVNHDMSRAMPPQSSDDDYHIACSKISALLAQNIILNDALA